MNISILPKKENWASLCERPSFEQNQLEQGVQEVIENVRQNGDQALSDYSLKFDGIELNQFLVTESEISVAINNVNTELKNAIQLAKSNIEKFHLSQVEESKVIETSKGVSCWRKSVGIEKVGLYIPGGTAPLFSTVLMLGIPAQLAGCTEVALCTPTNRKGEIHPAILYTAQLVGITKVVKIGGAQAIAAMTFGTESVPKVDKIFGPGNQYVTAAKQEATKYGVAIDMPAGPSEVLVYADETAIPAFVAADLLSQAEHGVDSQVVLVSPSEKFAQKVLAEINSQLETLPRKDIAAKALANSCAVILEDQATAIDLINDYAPEHLILAVKKETEVANQIHSAGSVFLGNYSPEAAGDYASGTNHTLPTSGYARNYSGVSLDSFVKKITYQKISPKGLKALGPAVEILAANEQLDAHKQAVSIRLEHLKRMKK